MKHAIENPVWQAALGQLTDWSVVHKFGANPDIDTAAAEDIWDGGGDYPWPSAAAETTIQSSSANDAAEGTGARTVQVYGLDTNFLEIDEVVTLNGTTAVTLTKAYRRVHRARVLTAGSGGVNAGAITVQHGATVITRISTGMGQTLMAIYTVPADYTQALMLAWYATLEDTQASKGRVALMTREFGGAWQTKELVGVSDSAGWDYVFTIPQRYPAKTDIRIRALAVSSNDSQISAGFDLLLVE